MKKKLTTKGNKSIQIASCLFMFYTRRVYIMWVHVNTLLGACYLWLDWHSNQLGSVTILISSESNNWKNVRNPDVKFYLLSPFIPEWNLNPRTKKSQYTPPTTSIVLISQQQQQQQTPKQLPFHLTTSS